MKKSNILAFALILIAIFTVTTVDISFANPTNNTTTANNSSSDEKNQGKSTNGAHLEVVGGAQK